MLFIFKNDKQIWEINTEEPVLLCCLKGHKTGVCHKKD
jgi:hypothetical protein